jgi:alpha-methylacyl-CoA racemase
MKKVFADAVRTRTREDWVTRAAGRGCVSAVLAPEESWRDPHNLARRTFIEVGGVTQPSPQPRFSRTPATVDAPPPTPGEHTRAALAAWGVPDDTVAAWERAGAVRQEHMEEIA